VSIDELLSHLSLTLVLLRQILDHLRLTDAMIEKETLNLLRESFDTGILEVEGFNKVLQFDIFILFHGLDDTWAQMGLLLHLIGLSLNHFLNLLLFLGIFNQQLLALLISLVKDFKKFLNLGLVITGSEELLSLLVELIILLGGRRELRLDFLGLVTGFDYLLLEENFLPFLFVHLELLFLNCLLVQLRHVAQEEGLLADLGQFAFKSLYLLFFEFHVPLVVGFVLELIDLSLNLLDVLSVSYHELLVLLGEGSLEGEVHELYHLVKAFNVSLNGFDTGHLLWFAGFSVFWELAALILLKRDF
jgi:hypothetical protein